MTVAAAELPPPDTDASPTRRPSALGALPVLGSGLGYRREIRQSILQASDQIDFLEVIAEQFTGDGEQVEELQDLARRSTVIPHGVGLSIGSHSLDPLHLQAIRRVSDLCRSPYYSEHLALTRAPGLDIGHLSPICFSASTLRRTVDHVKRVQDLLGKPLVLENVSYLLEVPGAQMSQAEFFGQLLDATDSGLLLDLTNLHSNAVNHGFDAREALQQLPLNRVVQLHLAGGFWSDGLLIDGHCEPVPHETWALLDALAALIPIPAAVLEHDSNFPDEFEVLLKQLRRARAALERSRAQWLGASLERARYQRTEPTA